MKWLLLLLVIQTALALNIDGTVYDFELNKLSNVIVEINSSPSQKIVAKEGSYYFNVQTGIYQIKASTSSGLVIREEIRALNEGDYVLDLILLTSLEDEEKLLDEEIETPSVEGLIEERPTMEWVIWALVFLLLAGFVIWFSRTKNNKELPEDLQNLLNFISSQGGRANQKDIYKNLSYSEAKISLMLDELEAQGIVKRIKKGRGNIIIKQS